MRHGDGVSDRRRRVSDVVNADAVGAGVQRTFQLRGRARACVLRKRRQIGAGRTGGCPYAKSHDDRRLGCGLRQNDGHDAPGVGDGEGMVVAAADWHRSGKRLGRATGRRGCRRAQP